MFKIYFVGMLNIRRSQKMIRISIAIWVRSPNNEFSLSDRFGLNTTVKSQKFLSYRQDKRAKT